MKKNKIIIFTTAWFGHVNMYEKYTLPSLKDDIDRLGKEGYSIELVQNGFDLTRLPEGKELHEYGAVNGSSAIILTGLRKTIQRCIDEDAVFFLAPPDTIFAKGTLYNLVKMNENKKDCIAIPHLRICAGDYKIQQPTSKELVNMCFDHPHEAFHGSFDNLEENGTWAGMSIREIGDGLYSFVHNMPTVYLADFSVQDLYFWQNTADWGQWDRAWLGMLFIENRLKVIGSSEMAFCAEITNSDSNAPPRRAHQYNDKPAINAVHNLSLNKFYCTLQR